MQAPDLLLLNVTPYPPDDWDAVYISKGRVESVGNSEELNRRVPASAARVDCGGRIVIPGLCDAHMHLLSYSLLRRGLDLRGVRSIEEMKEAVRASARSLRPGEWIVGRGWDQELFKEKRMPTRWDLDEVAPRTPVFLRRVCGHVAVANTEALRRAGITSETPDPPGGRIGRVDGEPDGLLYEDAMAMVERCIPPLSDDESIKCIVAALGEALAYGLTELHAMSVGERELRLIEKAVAAAPFKPPRIRCYVEPKLGKRIGRCKLAEGVYVEGIKVFMDGSLGARTAFLREPYSDAPGVRGMLQMSAKKLSLILDDAKRRGMQVAVHAIGDAAIEEVLKAVRELGCRHVRIEHASLTPPDIVEELAELKVPIAVQPHFIVTDWWVVSRLSDRARYVYAFKTLIGSGITVAGASDAPVEPLSPWEGMYAAVDRGRSEGLEIYACSAGEALSPVEALKLYTNGPQVAGYRGGVNVEVGRTADLVVLDAYTFPCTPSELRGMRVYATIVDGFIYRAGGRGSAVSSSNRRF